MKCSLIFFRFFRGVVGKSPHHTFSSASDHSSYIKSPNYSVRYAIGPACETLHYPYISNTGAKLNSGLFSKASHSVMWCLLKPKNCTWCCLVRVQLILCVMKTVCEVYMICQESLCLFIGHRSINVWLGDLQSGSC